MAFPSSPQINDVYFDETANTSFVWDGDKWITTGEGASFVEGPQGATGPEGPTGPTGVNDTILITESSDSDITYTIPFVSNENLGTAQLGLTKDIGGITFNPFSNRLRVQRGSFDTTQVDTIFINSEDTVNGGSSGIGYEIESSTGVWTLAGQNSNDFVRGYIMDNYSRLTVDFSYVSDDETVILSDQVLTYKISGDSLVTEVKGFSPGFVQTSVTPMATTISDPDIGLYSIQAGSPTTFGMGVFKKTTGALSGTWRLVVRKYYM